MTEEMKEYISKGTNWTVSDAETKMTDPMGGTMVLPTLAFRTKNKMEGFMIPDMDDYNAVSFLSTMMDEKNQKREFGAAVKTLRLKKDENGNYAGLLREMVSLSRVASEFGRKKGFLDANNKPIPQNTDMDNDENFWDNDGDFDDDDKLFGDPKDVDTPMPMAAGDEVKTGPAQTKGNVNHGGADLSKAMKAVSNIKGTRTR